MKKVRLTALIAALIIGVGVYFFLKELAKPQEIPRTEVVVALCDIPENTLITAEMVELRAVATESLHPHSLPDLKSVVGFVSSGAIYAGDQVISDRLVRTGELDEDNHTLAYVLENGTRAITISVSATSGLENMLKPGNRVDLINNYTYEVQEGEDTRTVTAARILVQNKKILAAGTELSRDGSGEYVTVTLQTTPEEALLINYAEYTGNLRLVLRSALDNDLTDIGEVDPDSFREGGDAS